MGALASAQTVHSAETTKMQATLNDLRVDMRDVKRDVGEFKPIAKKIQKWEQRAIGVSVFGGFGGAAVVAYVRGKLGI